MQYDFDIIQEYYNSLVEIKEIFSETTGASSMADFGLVSQYTEYLYEAERDLPGLLKPLNADEYFSHGNGGRSRYYRADGIRAHIGRNIGTLKAQRDKATSSPVTETKSFDFVTGAKIKDILIRDYQEIQRSIIGLNWKSTILLCGGAIEAILLDLLQKNEQAAKHSGRAPSESNLEKWILNDLIEVAVDAKLVGAEVAKLSHSVREYRNLIHPGVEVRTSLKVEPEEAKIAVEVLKILIRELS